MCRVPYKHQLVLQTPTVEVVTSAIPCLWYNPRVYHVRTRLMRLLNFVLYMEGIFSEGTSSNGVPHRAGLVFNKRGRGIGSGSTSAGGGSTHNPSMSWEVNTKSISSGASTPG
ncbi:hypothetical protein EYC84_003266 [Monilinia fructicola]|uniref:Uncharacterized protein n=1 Tax=Monilinia fructicola TaxID=38448 RepID=A0A5M9JY78_MONFR|nr:hypothetical protein EYC84_003266 [Monilinia fructicola]